jgi:hypothetical protein
VSPDLNDKTWEPAKTAADLRGSAQIFAFNPRKSVSIRG